MTDRHNKHTGWTTINGQRMFLTTTGGLGAESLDPNIRVTLGAGNLGHYALPAPPADLRPAIRASLGFLSVAPYSITLPLWASMYAAPLSPIKTLDAVLWVYGAAQSGKSIICHLALAHFGPTFVDGHGYRAPKDWASTPADLEQAMFMIKDAPIVIDNYASDPSLSLFKARQMAQKVHHVVRSVGNRPGRCNRESNLLERPQCPPRGMVISTARDRLAGQSIACRVVYVPVEAGQVIQIDEKSKEGKTELDKAQLQAGAGLYAQAMAGYVAWLAANWDRLAEELPNQISDTSCAERALFPSDQNWLANRYGLLATATSLALEYAKYRGALSQDDVDLQTQVCRRHLAELLCSQAEQIDQSQK